MMQNLSSNSNFVIFYRYQLLLIAIASTLGCVNGHILRTSCIIEANFAVVHQGKILQNAALVTLTGMSEIEYEGACVENEACKSINFHSSSKTCVINSKSLANDGASLVSDTGWIYKSTDYNEKLVRCHIG